MDNRIRLGVGILALGLFCLSPRAALAGEGGGRKSRTGTPAEPARTSDVPEGTHRLLELVNRERAAVGAAPLALRDDLVSLAAGFSRQMAAERNLRHNHDFLSPASAARLGARKLGENVAVEPAVDIAHTRLMASPVHRANILEPEFRFAGMAVARAADGSLYVTQDFLAPFQEAAVKPAIAAPAAAVAPRHRGPVRVARAARRSPVKAPAPPAASVAQPVSPPVPVSSPPVVLAPDEVLEPVSYVRAMPDPRPSAEGRHDAATFQLLVVGSTLALTVRRIR
jgi:hypothetical protein